MAAALGDLEQLALCSSCKRAFDEVERAPELLACQHHYCLRCARTELPGGAAALPTHQPVLALARRLKAGRPGAPPAAPPYELVATEAHHLRAELARLASRRRPLLLRALDAVTALKGCLETELAAPVSPPPSPPPGPAPAPLAAAVAERERLRARLSQALLQARLDELARGATCPLDFELLGRALPAPGGASPPPPAPPGDPLLLLANYCTTQLFLSRRMEVAPGPGSPLTRALVPVPGSPLPRALAPRALPLVFFELSAGGAALGRVVVQVREDVAPRMARNFTALATGGRGGRGAGYRGSAVLQCWRDESVIAGDVEPPGGHFLPDDTGLAAERGAVGMRRSQKRHDTLGLVGSQFRIVLREMRGFTAIFASVVEGLELVDRLSRSGDGAGKPRTTVLISSCGQLN